MFLKIYPAKFIFKKSNWVFFHKNPAEFFFFLIFLRVSLKFWKLCKNVLLSVFLKKSPAECVFEKDLLSNFKKTSWVCF